jgi:hypothetical protein
LVISDPFTDILEFATGQLFAALVRKFFDERVRSRHHFREIKTNIFRADAPQPGMTGEVQDFGGLEQRLCGHAAAQDAQPANSSPPIIERFYFSGVILHLVKATRRFLLH